MREKRRVVRSRCVRFRIYSLKNISGENILVYRVRKTSITTPSKKKIPVAFFFSLKHQHTVQITGMEIRMPPAEDETWDFEIARTTLEKVYQNMRELGRPDTDGVHFLQWKWYDNWVALEMQGLPASEGRSFYHGHLTDEQVLLRAKKLVSACVYLSIHGWDKLVETSPGSREDHLLIRCRRTDWPEAWFQQERRKGNLSFETWTEQVKDIRALSDRLGSDVNVRREYGWFLRAADLLELTRLRVQHGPW